MALEIHRARDCELARVWAADASSVDSLSALQQQSQAVWTAVDASAVSVTNGAIELRAEDAEVDAILRIAVPLDSNATLHRLSLRTQLPQNGQARLLVQLPTLKGLAMALGSAPTAAAASEVFLGSSQNTSLVAELPCVTDVADAFRDVDFVWDDKWIRWFVDDVLLLEEFVQDEDVRSDSESGGNVVIELRVGGSEAKLAVERISLNVGNASDPFCAPRYSSSSNCRAHESFTPRLGSLQGSLSVDEVEAYIDEVAAAFPLITKVDELGRSVENRPLRALCLGACYATAGQNVPQALFTGMHHAREPISMMNLVYTIDILTTDYRNGDLAALEILSSRQLWFFLVVNPDGYAHNEMLRVWEHNQWGQRKSAAPTCDKSPRDAGVDLNRNYDVCFARDTKGSSNDTCGDDYNGPSAFSEPETQAVRELVERNTSDFSVALNYHSYGRYFNLPFACQAEGVPTEPNNAIFVALAREMAHFNGFNYGQSWKDSNLYTVNGETSDWMWQAHRIFAMSPEVGPAFKVQPAPGFWPPREDVPQLSSELHYSNLHIARMAGPVYSLVVKGVQLGTIDEGGSTLSFVSVDVAIFNAGLRPAMAEMVGSMFMNGTSASDAVFLEPQSESEDSEASAQETRTLMIPYSGVDFHQSMQEVKALYVVIRDSFSCHLFRVAVHFDTAVGHANHSSFQIWRALPLPRCGTCEIFGVPAIAAASTNTLITSPMCPEIEDVAFLGSVRTRIIDPAEITGVVGDNIATRSRSTAAPTPTTTTSTTVTLDASANSASDASAPTEITDNQGARISSTILPLSVSWSGPFAMALLAGFVLLVVIFLFFRRCRRRNKKKPARAKAPSGVQKRQSNVQYSRIDEDTVASPATKDKQLNYNDQDEEIDLLDAECGERGAFVNGEDDVMVQKDRAHPAPRRTSKLRSSSEDIV